MAAAEFVEGDGAVGALRWGVGEVERAGDGEVVGWVSVVEGADLPMQEDIFCA